MAFNKIGRLEFAKVLPYHGFTKNPLYDPVLIATVAGTKTT